MKTADLIENYGGWICKDERGRTYIAVPYEVGLTDAERIANSVLKENYNNLSTGIGFMKDGYIYFDKVGGKKVWITRRGGY